MGIPVRDQGRFLGDAVASALAQEGVALEVLVHDDASSDDTAAVVGALRDPRVRYLRHASPLGVAENRNTLLAAARAPFMAWLDADDSYLPGALARQVAVLERLPSVSLVHGGVELVDEDGRRLRPWPAPFAADAVESGRDAFRQLLASNEITTSTVVTRRSAHVSAGPFSGAAGSSSSDWHMWLRLALQGDVAYTAAPVARYRQHERTISRTTAHTGERLRCDVRVAKRVLRRERAQLLGARALGRVANAALAAKALSHAGDAQARGERRAALAAVALAVRLAPGAVLPHALTLLGATARGDDAASLTVTREILARLAGRLAGTRHGAKVAAAARVDPVWEATLARIAETVRRVVPPDGNLATVAKWDPTLLRLSERRGRQFPDLGAVPDGYPRQDATVIRHLEAVRGEGVSHIVFPSASFWWLDHYTEFAGHLRDRYATAWRDADCAIYDIRESRVGGR